MNTMHLVGAEDVRRAGSNMNEAAQNMRSAASHIDSAMQEHQRFMTDWLREFREIMEAKK